MRRFALATLVVAAVSGVYAGAAGAANPNNTTALQKAVKVSDILVHERALAGIAQRNGNTRASGTRGFEKSRDYVVDTLTKAGYKPTVQAFDFPFFSENTPSTFDRVSPNPHTYSDDEFGHE